MGTSGFRTSPCFIASPAGAPDAIHSGEQRLLFAHVGRVPLTSRARGFVQHVV